ncbi:tRNA (adenosine(37)-N6)-threonylcarbamoyltransferase complex dimerization subunit type 1 TsaB [Telmatospirillum sp. J64-1]|uniref:tRNA (adenosine(37)-N6)-threonylcarbamoyltransferase complex dimerization subunit type 1 TsaB n=1 Tax=Telmatospirillum sp. J64-1 TaxID=2502183 RepID=UPI00115F639B|nr:tRNA (adenosine(37)-N6)-threonylcarbamoyltransferase complex dimerization subunit type 1 TsaB [Telmatospirillum sp. J64-1]
MSSPVFLAFDTATSACSVAILRDGEVLAHCFAEMARGQSEALPPMIAEALAQSGLSFREITALAVTVGPGAFTGLRIGLATARAMALAADLPAIGVSTTEAIAEGVGQDERAGRNLLVAVESKREDVFAQAFGTDLRPLGEIVSVRPEDAFALAPAPALLCGDAAARLPEAPEGWLRATGSGLPDALHVARVAARHWAEGRTRPAEPLYLRAPDVNLPKGAA